MDSPGPHNPPFVFSVARHPAVPAAVCFLPGIGLYARVPTRPGLWLVAAALCVVLVVGLRRRPLVASSLLCCIWFVAGVAGGQLAAYRYPADHVGLYAAEEPRLAQIEVRFDDPPRIVSNPFDNRRAMPPKQTALAEVSKILTTSGWRPAAGEILLQINDPHPKLAAGQTVRLIGLLQRPAAAQNPGQFDWAGYYRERRVLTSFTVGRAECVEIVAEAPPGWLTAARGKARALLADGFVASQSLDHALLRALLLGDNDPALRDVQDQFQQTGTAHHLAISGTHVALLAAAVWGVCRLTGVRPPRAAWVALLFTVGYGALALPSPPVVRSVVLAAAMGLGLVSGRQGQPLSLLAASVVAMLVFHPPDLFNAGFQLSFGTVLGLVLLAKPMLHALEHASGYNDPDRVVMRQLAKPTWWRKLGHAANRAALTTLAAGLVAWMVSMPLIAYHFEQLNPWAIVAGIVLGPVVMLALAGGMLKVLLTLAWPALSPHWAMMAATPVRWMRQTVDSLAGWPYADVPVPPSPWWLLVLFYGLLLTAIWRGKPAGVRWPLRIGRFVCAAFVVLPPLQERVAAVTSTVATEVTVLSVGAGQCVVVQPPGGRTLLIDAGSSSLADLMTKGLGPFLRHARVTRLDTLVLSHADFDHVSAAAEVTRVYDVREVLTGDRFADYVSADPQTRGLIKDLAALNRPPRVVKPGDRTPIGRETVIEILWPPEREEDETAEAETADGLSTNDGSLVFRLTHAGHSILFPGDIQDQAMRQLLKEPEKLKADVLIAMHHGSAEALTGEFIAAVDPATIVSSNDRTLTAKQREFDRLCSGRRLLRTNDCGAITIRMEGEGVTVTPFIEQ